MQRRFLILTQYYAPEIGAAPLRNAAIARELAKRGFDVRVLTTFPSHRMKEIPPRYRRRLFMRERVDGIEVVRIWAWPHPKKSLWGRLVSYATFMVTSVIGAFLVPRPTHLYVHTPPIFLALSALLAARLVGAEAIVNVSDLWPESAQAVGVVRVRAVLWLGERLARFIYRHADRVTLTSEQAVEALIAKGLPKEKLIFLPNGADTETFRPVEAPDVALPEPLRRLANRKVFVYAGNVGIAQDFESMVEVADALRERRDIAFAVVGEGPRKEWLATVVRERQLDNFAVVDAVPPESLPPIFAHAVASIVTLRKADLFLGVRPSKIYVSLACAKPIIYTGGGESAHLIESNGVGLVVPPEDPAALAAAVRRLAENPDEAALMGRKGRELVEREYSWSVIVDRFLRECGLRAA